MLGETVFSRIPAALGNRIGISPADFKPRAGTGTVSSLRPCATSREETTRDSLARDEVNRGRRLRRRPAGGFSAQLRLIFRVARTRFAD